MSLIPAFDMGLWNAWIFMIWLLVVVFLEPLHGTPRGREEGSDFTAEFGKTQKYAVGSIPIIYLLAIIYSIFVPLKLGTAWFYAGLPIYLSGLISYALVWVGFATTPPDKPVTTGIYRYSRNPMRLSQVAVFLGVGIATASWVFLLLPVVYMIMSLLFVDAEERHCLKHYGDAYREYMKRTPQWIGIPKSRRK